MGRGRGRCGHQPEHDRLRAGHRRRQGHAHGGQLDLSNTSEPVAIYDGSGEGPVTISGNYDGGVFQVDSGVTASIAGLTIAAGTTPYFGTGTASVNVIGTLTLSECTVSNDSPTADSLGYGVMVEGTADITDCTITGGGFYHGEGVDVRSGTADLTGCAIENNTGGGLFNNGTTTLVNCTISGNTAAQPYDLGGGGLFNTGELKAYATDIAGNGGLKNGGGLYNDGTAYLSGCTINGNRSDNQYGNGNPGGGIYNGRAALVLSSCTIGGNGAVSGGGLDNEGTAIISNSSLWGNSAELGGGGVANGLVNKTAVLTVTDSTIDDNFISVGYEYEGGAGVLNEGQATLTDCTIVANDGASATFSQNNGGGLDDSGTATLVACTITGNTTSASGGGIYVGGTGSDIVMLYDTIVAGNEWHALNGSDESSNDVVAGSSGAVVSGSYDLLGTGGSAGFTNGVNGNIVLTSLVDLGLGPLGNYGGTTQTVALAPESPAIAAGSLTFEVGPNGKPLATDERGFALDTPAPDIGAYQATSPPISVSFGGLYSQSASYGTPSITVAGFLAGTSVDPGDAEDVQVTLAGVTEPAVAEYGGGYFTATFDTSTLPVSSTPYTVTYSYPGDGIFTATSATSLLTVDPAIPTVNVVDAGGRYTGSPLSATAAVTGASGLVTSSLEGVPLTLTYYAGSTTTGTPLAVLPPGRAHTPPSRPSPAAPTTPRPGRSPSPSLSVGTHRLSTLRPLRPRSSTARRSPSRLT